jgi:signal transduction histidine kinase
MANTPCDRSRIAGRAAPIARRPALEALVERSAMSSGLDIRLHTELQTESTGQPGRLAPAIETTVYRVVQEALTNAVKHAHATTVEIDVTADDGGVRIVVGDDGSGFAVEDPTDGFGLIGMRERIRLVGGRHEVDSTPGHGTIVRATIPATPIDPGRATAARTG